jgi:hypothetical protein
MKKTLLALLATLTFAFTALAADITGKWTGEVAGRNGPQPFNLTLVQTGNTLTGEIAGGRGPLAIVDGKVDGDTITFSTSQPGRDGGAPNVQKYTGKVKGDSIDFTREGGRGPVMFTVKKG